MIVSGPIFLSASVPVEGRAGSESFDPYLIREAVSALVEVTLGRRLLVWGGHPAITPMIWEAAKQYDVRYDKTVQLFQSKFFDGCYPEEITKFDNFVEVEAVPGDHDASLLALRREMFHRYDYAAAVFIGGMEGVVEEFELFREHNAEAKVLPIPSPGGVSRELFQRRPNLPRELEHAVDFSFWFYNLLDVSMLEERKNTFD